jgi:leader peptidase (prepilin peptidase) / N-methyltransferase
MNQFESITGLPVYFGYIFFFAIGSVIGSFLNVVIHRVPLEESVVFPNSGCPKCEKPIKSYDNIPILSWLFLGGKCRNCKNPISPRYIFVEILTGLLFTLVFWQIGLNWYLPVALIFTAAIVPLIFIDAEHQILPDVITKPGIIFAVLVRLAFPLLLGTVAYFDDLKYSPLANFQQYPAWLISLAGCIFGGLVGGGSLWLVGEIWKKLRGVDAMGLGDVKMMFAVGGLLGWRLTILTIFIGAFAGSLAGVGAIIFQKKSLQEKLPFGIFLGIGAIVAMLFGEQIIAWYLNNFVPR